MVVIIPEETGIRTLDGKIAVNKFCNTEPKASNHIQTACIPVLEVEIEGSIQAESELNASFPHSEGELFGADGCNQLLTFEHVDWALHHIGDGNGRNLSLEGQIINPILDILRCKALVGDVL